MGSCSLPRCTWIQLGPLDTQMRWYVSLHHTCSNRYLTVLVNFQLMLSITCLPKVTTLTISPVSAVAFHGDCLYVAGLLDPSVPSPHPWRMDLRILDFASQQWTLLTAADAPPSSAGAHLASAGHKLLLFAGKVF